MTDLVVKDSKIHGKGVFTAKAKKAKTRFYIIPLEKVFNYPMPRWAFIGNNKWVDDDEILNWINHSCEANTKLDLKEGTPVLIAKRDISSGEEITCDYNETEFDGIKVPCTCKSKKCRKYFLRKE